MKAAKLKWFTREASIDTARIIVCEVVINGDVYRAAFMVPRRDWSREAISTVIERMTYDIKRAQEKLER